MVRYTRREFTSVLVASLAMPLPRRITQPSAAEAATVRGVRIGAITGVYGPFAPAAGQDVVDVVIARSLDGGSDTSSS